MTGVIAGLVVYLGIGLGITAQVYGGAKEIEDGAILMFLFWPIAVVGGIVFTVIGYRG